MATATRTHYEILGITRDADATEVKRAWKVLVQVWHPDRFTGDMEAEAERATADINAAYHCLRDCSRRAAYDCSLAADDERQAAASRPAPRSSGATRPGNTSRVTTSGQRSIRFTAEPPTTPPPSGMIDVAARASQDIIDTMKRSPRAVAIVAACFAVLVLGSLLIGALTGPSLPAGTPAAHAQGPAPSVARSQDMPSLDDIVEEAGDDDEGLEVDAPLPDDEELGEEGLPHDEHLEAPPLADPGPEAQMPPPGPRVVKTRKNGKDVLRVLPAI